MDVFSATSSKFSVRNLMYLFCGSVIQVLAPFYPLLIIYIVRQMFLHSGSFLTACYF